MKKVYQTKGLTQQDGHDGDCFAACVASILETSINKEAQGNAWKDKDKWFENIQKIYKKDGVKLTRINSPEQQKALTGYYIGVLNLKNGSGPGHAVVMFANVGVVHNPLDNVNKNFPYDQYKLVTIVVVEKQ